MNDINNRIAANEFAFKRLLKKYKVQGQGIEAIKAGYQKHGETFLWLVADVLVPSKPTSPFISNNTPADEPWEGGPQPYDYSAGETTPQKKNFFDTMMQLIGISNAAAESYQNWKYGTPTQPMYQEPAPVSKPNYIIWAAAIAVIVLLFLIFRK